MRTIDQDLRELLGLPPVEVNSKEVTTTTIVGETEHIIIPKNMSKLEASKQLKMQHDEEETVIDLVHSFNKWDGKDALVSIMKTIKGTFGWVPGQATMTMFGPVNPREVQVVTNIVNGKEVYENCFVGEFGIMAWDKAKGEVQMGRDGSAYVKFAVKKKFKERANQFFADVEQHLLDHSIYKNKSIVIDNNGFSFVENKGSNDIILNESEERIITNLVIAPLAKDGKRCILFTGPYGTGKTETAMRIGRVANEKAITFIYCKDSSKFAALLNTAKQYQPALVFMEDIDEIGSGEDRDANMNEILNTLDGVQTKGNDITVIFTTNHEDRINKALRRPGRIDLILKFNKCEPATIAKIYDRLFSGFPGCQKLDYTMLASKTPEVQGAVIAEICKRAKRIAESTDGTITNDIVLASIDSMKDQIKFMEADPEAVVDKRVQAMDAFSDLVAEKAASKVTENLNC